MIPVLTLGDPRDLRLFQALRGLLAGKGPLLALGSREVWLPGGKTPFLLGDCGLVSQIWGNGLLAVKNCQLLPSSLYAQEGSLAVICSHHRESVELLARTGIQAVTCGLPPRDTVTFSSLEPGRGTVALQRPLRLPAFSLRAEPGEFPAAFPPQWDAYTVLCCGAVAALLGLAEDGMELREEE